MHVFKPLAAAIAAALVSGSAAPSLALAQDSSEETATLDRIEVTGSRIRRVDTETASPVYALSREQLERTGAVTVGDLLQETPSIAGAATNPQVNNGGGDGAAAVELRGLGTNRTLVLINGRRVIRTDNTTSYYVDINAIPINMIDRIEILKDGASAIYGSDAVGGVVNFIMRKDFNGAEFNYDYGVSGEDDGQREGFSVTWGHSSDRGALMLGLNYNRQESVSAADRDFSNTALYLSSGSVIAGGSSRTPTGRFFLPADLAAQYGCGSVTRISGAAGDSLDDFRCFVPGPDSYNYQEVGNLLMTPQERGGLFTVGNYFINDDLEFYAEAYYNKTSSSYAIAPLPFDARSDGLYASRDSIYNPFGADIGVGSTNLLVRLEALGNREASYDTDTTQINAGLRGGLGDSWSWDASVGWGRVQQFQRRSGYLYQPALQAALGPSFIDAGGVPRCGTPDAPIAGCVPVNFFNLGDATQVAALRNLAANPSYTKYNSVKQASFNLTGDLWELPAGWMSAAFGFDYRDEYSNSQVDFLAVAQPPDYSTCYVAQEACSGPQVGRYDSKEVYAEFFVPILSGVAWAEALNLTLGTRYSEFSQFDSDSSSKVGLEWRPTDELLARATWAEVYRVPTIIDLYGPATPSSPTVIDPCNGLTTPVGQNQNIDRACQNVPRDGSYQQANGQVTGLLRGNADLQPENGETVTWGFVYDPGWMPGLSTSLDVWQYELHDTIEQLQPATVFSQCYNAGLLCELISRFPDGQVNIVQQPTFNLGLLEAEGFDLGFKYAFDTADWGDFRFGLDTTYIAKFDRQTEEGNPATQLDNAGVYSPQDGQYSRVRALGSVNWTYGDFSAGWRAQYIGPFDLGSPNTTRGNSADGSIPNVVLNYGSHTYHNVDFSYALPQWKTTLRVGVDNVGDKQPPILYQNNVTNANTDVSTFDAIGRYYWARISVAF